MELKRTKCKVFFRFLQIRDFVKKKFLPNFEVLNKHDTIEAVNKFDPGSQGAISAFFRMLHGGQIQRCINGHGQMI